MMFLKKKATRYNRFAAGYHKFQQILFGLS